MKYFENRQNATNADENEMELIFQCIAEQFSHKWLKSRGSNPLQQLWNRKDALSTNELYFFGNCLRNLIAVDANWVKQQVKHIKSDHINNRQGSLFEINGLGILSSQYQEVRPTKGNNPGFDGILNLDSTKIMRLSLKNYGDSAHYKEFTSYAYKFEQELKKILKEKNIISIQIFIDSNKEYPSKKNWEDLIKNLPSILNDVKKGQPKYFKISDFWFFGYGDLKDDYQEFHSNYNSYQLILSSPFHRNEHKNLLDKLDDACANLIKHASTEDENTINTVFIHVPESASILQLKQWSEEYLLMFPHKPITGIILYQPTVAEDLGKGTNFIHHCIQLIFQNEKILNWNPLLKQINFEFPVGILSDKPTENKMIFEINSKTETVNLNDRYVYQRGNLYLNGKKADDGSITGNIKRVSSGIFTHTILHPVESNPTGIILSGHFAPADKLLIL